MTLGKNIRIYLKDGTVSGIKLAEVVNLTIQAISCPRNKLSDLNIHFQKETNKPGVYFLLGFDEEENKNIVYIGEAENVWDRLKSHDLQKEFWNEVILFSSKDDNLTKSHVKYLESKLINLSITAGRYKIQNSNNPSLNSLPLPEKDSMEEYLINIQLLTGTLGHKFMENTIQSIKSTTIDSNKSDSQFEQKADLELVLNVKGIRANAILTDEGIVVLSQSEVSHTETKNYGYKTLREELFNENIISLQNGKNVFIKNYLFKSPSSAAAVILGYSVNGRNIWKELKSGKSINEIENLLIK